MKMFYKSYVVFVIFRYKKKPVQQFIPLQQKRKIQPIVQPVVTQVYLIIFVYSNYCKMFENNLFLLFAFTINGCF